MLAALKPRAHGCTVEVVSLIAVLAAAGAVVALAAGGAAQARPEHANNPALSSSTVCEILASSTAERAAKKLLPRLPARIRASALLPLVVGGAIEFCPDLAPRAATSAKSLYRSLFGAPEPSPGVDRLPPSVLGPGHGIPGGWRIGNDGTLPVKAYWLALDASGLNRVTLIVIENGHRRTVAVAGAYSALATQVLRYGTRYQFGVRAVDRARNWREAFGPAFTPQISDDSSARISTGWSRVSDPLHHGGATLTSSSGSAWATFSFLGSAVALIAPRWSGGGTASLRVDGVPAPEARFYAPRLLPREVVFGRRWSGPGSHTVEVRPTTGQAAIDAFVVLG
jgi:hypothetical protein